MAKYFKDINHNSINHYNLLKLKPYILILDYKEKKLSGFNKIATKNKMRKSKIKSHRSPILNKKKLNKELYREEKICSCYYLFCYQLFLYQWLE